MSVRSGDLDQAAKEFPADLRASTSPSPDGSGSDHTKSMCPPMEWPAGGKKGAPGVPVDQEADVQAPEGALTAHRDLRHHGGTHCDMPAVGGAAVLRMEHIQGVEIKGPPPTVSDVLTMTRAFRAAADNGAHKVHSPIAHSCLQALMAGIYVTFGAVTAMYIGGNMPGVAATDPGLASLIFGIFGFPTGLLAVVLTGAELFTGNCLVCTAAWAEGRCTTPEFLRSLAVSWLGNLCGALLFVGIFTGAGFAEKPEDLHAFMVSVAAKKTSHNFGQTFLRGLLANFLVDLAVLQAAICTTFVGKFVGIFLATSMFAALGLEHVVANMSMVPLGMIHGADVGVGKFIYSNLIPVTLGNYVGGGVMIGMVYALLFGRWSRTFSNVVRWPKRAFDGEHH
ncbi:unnamed protein product [Pedinophyceae sp. YPF-701]|nr:unnamed protein product [Pedinophyceae sp. YPF-701]